MSKFDDFDFRDHDAQLIKNFRHGSRMLRCENPDGAACSICCHISHDLASFQGHFNNCRQRLENLKHQVGSSKSGLFCDVCDSSFKTNFAFNKHKKKCQPKISEDLSLLGYPDAVNDAEFKCLLCALPFATSQEVETHACDCLWKTDNNVLTSNLHPCKLCPSSFNCKFPYLDQLAKHYVFAHYQNYFERVIMANTSLNYPFTCTRKGCDYVIDEVRDLAFHVGITHKKLKKALEKEVHCDMQDVIKLFYQDGSFSSSSMKSPPVSMRNSVDETHIDSGLHTNSGGPEPLLFALQKAKNGGKKYPGLGVKGLTCPHCNKVCASEGIGIHLSGHFQ